MSQINDSRLLTLVHAARAAMETTDECIFYGPPHDTEECAWFRLEKALELCKDVPPEKVSREVEIVRCRNESWHFQAIREGKPCPRCGILEADT